MASRYRVLESVSLAAGQDPVLLCTRAPKPPRRSRRFTGKDLQLLLLHGTLSAGARILPVERWSAMCRITALPKRYRVWRDLGEFQARAEAVLGPQPPAATRSLLRRRVERLHERHLTYLRERIRPHPVDWEMGGLERLHASLAKGRGAILWTTPSLVDTFVTKRALFEAGIRGYQVSVVSHGMLQTAFAMRRMNPAQWAVEERYLAGRVIFDDNETTGAIRKVLARLAEGAPVLFANTQFAGRAFFAVPFAPGFRLIMARTPLSIAVKRDVPIHLITGVETDSFRRYRFDISEDLRGAAPSSHAGDLPAEARAALTAASALRQALVAAPDQIRVWDSMVRADDLQP